MACDNQQTISIINQNADEEDLRVEIIQEEEKILNDANF